MMLVLVSRNRLSCSAIDVECRVLNTIVLKNSGQHTWMMDDILERGPDTLRRSEAIGELQVC